MSEDEVRKIMEKEVKVRRKIARSKARDMIYETMSRLVKALDGTAWNMVFLQLWSLLEWLCNKENSAKYDRIIERAVSIFPNRQDRDYHRSILNILCSHRNQFVHESIGLECVAGPYQQEKENLLRILKDYIDYLINFLIKYSGRLSSRASLCEHLDDLIDINSFQGKLVDSERLRFLVKERSKHLDVLKQIESAL